MTTEEFILQHREHMAGVSDCVAVPSVLTAVQSGGGIVVEVSLDSTTSRSVPGSPDREAVRERHFELVRFSPAGQLDPAFGDGARVTLDELFEAAGGSGSVLSYISLLALPDGGLSLLSTVGYYPPFVADAAAAPAPPGPRP